MKEGRTDKKTETGIDGDEKQTRLTSGGILLREFFRGLSVRLLRKSK
jgi:hypothetical protein